MRVVDKNIYCVYVHRNSFTKEIFYVGIGSIKRAWNITGRSEYWKRYVAKYGRTVHVLFENIGWQEAGQIEQYLIRYYGRTDIERGPLVNRCDGGEGAVGQIGPWKGKKRPELALLNKDKSIKRKGWSGKTHSEASKIKMGATKKQNGFVPWNKGLKNAQPKWTEEQRAKRIAWLTGRKHSEETKAKMSQASIGKPKTEECKAKLKGVPKSAETRLKLSISKKGTTLTEQHKLNIGRSSKIAWSKRKQQKTA